jgi:hypothetical protein
VCARGRTEREGSRVNRLHIAEPNPAKLLKVSLPAVTTTYVLRLDADTSVSGDIARAVAAVHAEEADVCSIKCAVANRTNIVIPVYSLIQILIMLPIGAVHYFFLVRGRRTFGRYRFGYRRGPVAPPDSAIGPTIPAA